jgi:oxygen-independent coproporphyrinogen-3 oxidase
MEEISIYIHFPYCELKCPYCDFNSHVASDFKEKELLECYKKELDFFFSEISGKRKLRSIFFGGGTPSLMNAETVFEIINYIKSISKLVLRETLEVTLEANPSSSEMGKFLLFKEAGINRLSIGIQSLNPSDLQFLGRKHSANEAIKTLEIATKAFNEFSFDLIYCLPGQTLEKWKNELEFAIKNFAKNHISLYTLTIEKGTPFYKMHSEKKFLLPKNEEDFYFLTNETTEKFNLNRYEISNYAKTGSESKHNLSYWQTIDYLGIGPGAHGRFKTIHGNRVATYNFASPEKYIESVLRSGNALQTKDIITENEQIKEILLMNLRTKSGINLNDIKTRLDIDITEKLSKKTLLSLENSGLIEISDTYLRLTDQGLSLANAITSKLMT